MHPKMSVLQRVAPSILLQITIVTMLGACAGTNQLAGQRIIELAPDWQAHSKPLFYSGFGIGSGNDRWLVPAIMPKGNYILVAHEGDHYERIDAARLQLDGDPAKKIYIMLSRSYRDIEAVPEAYVK